LSSVGTLSSMTLQARRDLEGGISLLHMLLAQRRDHKKFLEKENHWLSLSKQESQQRHQQEG
jgi:hypothetical protein